MTGMYELTAAVVGTGFIGTVHVDAIRRLGVRIAGVVGSSPERTREKAGQLGLHAYADFQEMLADDQVKVVHITSPNEEHPRQAEAALRAGKHVVCEKPLALTSAETELLRGLAASSGLVAAVNFNIRFYPHVQEMRSRILSGSIGRPYLVTGSYLQDWLLLETDWNWRVEKHRGGALRVVADIGSHWFDLASYVTGQRIVSVLAELPTFIPVRKRPTGAIETFARALSTSTTEVRIESEDAALILVRFEGGARGVLAASQVSAGRKNSVAVEVSASRSSVAWRGERPDELWIGHRSKPNELLLRDPSLLSGDAATFAAVPGGHAEGFENTFRAMYRAVYSDIASGARPARPAYATFEDGHQEAKLLDAVAESAVRGAWVDVV